MGKKNSNVQRGSKNRSSRQNPTKPQSHRNAPLKKAAKQRGTPNFDISAMFSAFLNRIRLILGNALKILAEDLRMQRILALVLVCILGIGGISFIWHQMTVKNAYAVFVDEAQIGLLSNSKLDDANELLEQAVMRIESREGTKVLLNEKVSFELVHGSKKDFLTAEDVISKIASSLTYKVEAFIISVEGTSLTTLKSRQEAEGILKSIQEPYLQDGVNIIEVGFVENVTVESAYVEADEINDSDRALRILTSTLETSTTYRVVSGDYLGLIASKAGMSFAEILAVNPGLTPNTVLHIGDIINLTVDKPLISVRTVEKTSYIDVEPKPIQYLQNSNEKTSYQKTIQYGTVGQAEVICHTIRINGMESETLIFERVITVDPVPEIIEVGTK